MTIIGIPLIEPVEAGNCDYSWQYDSAGRRCGRRAAEKPPEEFTRASPSTEETFEETERRLLCSVMKHIFPEQCVGYDGATENLLLGR